MRKKRGSKEPKVDWQKWGGGWRAAFLETLRTLRHRPTDTAESTTGGRSFTLPTPQTEWRRKVYRRGELYRTNESPRNASETETRLAQARAHLNHAVVFETVKGMENQQDQQNIHAEWKSAPKNAEDEKECTQR